jgi:hypothetical protein
MLTLHTADQPLEACAAALLDVLRATADRGQVP